MRKAAWIGAVLFAVFTVGVIALFLIDFDSPALEARLLRAVSEKAGVQLTAEGFHLNLLRGLRLDDVRLVTESPSTACRRSSAARSRSTESSSTTRASSW
jgi:hypothetical protein